MSAQTSPCPNCRKPARCTLIKPTAPPILCFFCEDCQAGFDLKEERPEYKIEGQRAGDFLILQLVKAAGGAVQFKIPQPLTPDQQGALQNACMIPGIKAFQTGDVLSLSIDAPAPDLNFIKDDSHA